MPAFWRKLIPTKNDREVRRLTAKVEPINAFEQKLKALPDAALQAKTGELRQKYEQAFAALGGDRKVFAGPRGSAGVETRGSHPAGGVAAENF